MLFMRCDLTREYQPIDLGGKLPSSHVLPVIARSMFYDLSSFLLGFDSINYSNSGFYLQMNMTFYNCVSCNVLAEQNLNVPVPSDLSYGLAFD